MHNRQVGLGRPCVGRLAGPLAPAHWAGLWAPRLGHSRHTRARPVWAVLAPGLGELGRFGLRGFFFFYGIL